jgi:tetratricopeptide (TPR) repeat protein
MHRGRTSIWAVFAGVFVVASAGVGYVLSSSHKQTPPRDRSAVESVARATDRDVPLFSDNWIDNLGVRLIPEFDEPDPRDLAAAQTARAKRSERRLAAVQSRLETLSKDDPRTLESWREYKNTLARILLSEGDFRGAATELRDVQATYPESSYLHANYEAALGVAAMRRGEVENCVSCQNEASCVFPLAAAAIHQKKAGSREAIEHFNKYLNVRPDDLGARWLLNVLYMTLGEYPDRVPKDRLIDLARFRSTIDVGRFRNVAMATGIGAIGPRYAGGSAIDDFNGDGLLDIVSGTESPEQGASLFINKGDGTFEDRAVSAGLASQVGSLNLKHTDYDNDGNLDVLFLRGAWENAQRMSLMRNRGDGTFEDATVSAGLDRPIASASAGWADYDNDGFVDLYVAGETKTKPSGDPFANDVDSPNTARLYHNNGDGTFTDLADRAGVRNVAFAKGVAWGDYDLDGYPDLFVSNMGARSRFFHNKGDGTFEEVGSRLKVPGTWTGFACWFWDYDNDGDLDLFVNGFFGSLQQTIASMIGRPLGGESPRLYRNDRENGFRDVTEETGLNRLIMAMGCNFGDIDNDGYLDIYEGTGKPEYAFLIPNVMLKNDRGGRFVDVTLASGTGHLQKGHGVSFGDWNNDGYADLFVRAGGAFRGDQANAVLFQNPGGTNHWIYVKLIGKKTNRAAIGAAVKITLEDEPGYPSPNIRYRVVSAGSSWGGNGFPMTIGLGAARTIKSLEVIWPTSKTKQTFKDVKIDQSISVTEFADRYETLDRKPIRPPDGESIEP